MGRQTQDNFPPTRSNRRPNTQTRALLPAPKPNRSDFLALANSITPCILYDTAANSSFSGSEVTVVHVSPLDAREWRDGAYAAASKINSKNRGRGVRVAANSYARLRLVTIISGTKVRSGERQQLQ